MLTIEADALTRDYDGARAVDHVTFGVAAGEIFGFLGSNGAGKTTTIKMLTGQLRPTSGRATVCGFDVVTQRQQLKPTIGVVFEYQNIYERMTARENLRFSARLYGINGNRVQEMLYQVGLHEQARKKTANFSNGMKQRLLIARALLHRPQVLFLDEPTKGLDPGVAHDIRALVQGLKEQGVTVFLTTHYMEEADRLCDRVAILHKGRIVALAGKDIVDALKTKTTLTVIIISLLMVLFYRYFPSLTMGGDALRVFMYLVPNLMVEEKQTKTLDALLVSPASTADLVAGKALAGLFYGLLGSAVVLFVFRYLIIQWKLAILAAVSGTLFMVAVGLLLGSSVKARAQLQLVGWFVVIPLLIPVILVALEGLVPRGAIAVMNWIPTVLIAQIFRLSLTPDAARFLPAASPHNNIDN